MKDDASYLCRTQARCGSWHLASGGALSLKPKSSARLHISAGRAWVTLDASTPMVSPDWVLYPEDTLFLPAHRHVVVESWPRWVGDELYFRWDPA